MSLDSPYEQQERHIAYGTGIFFVITIWLIFLQGYIITWVAPFEKITSSIPELLAIPTLTAIGFAVGYFLKYLGMHKLLDKATFKVEKEVNNYITQRLLTYFNNSFKYKDQCREPTPLELSFVFYEFANKQQDSWLIQRALAFSYWLKYRLSMNLIVLSIFGFSFSLITGAISWNFNTYTWIALSFFSIVWIISLVISQKKVRPELITWVAKPQLDRIIFDNRAALDTILKNRFAKSNAGL